MRFIRVGEPGAERPGVDVGDGRFVDVSDIVSDIDGAFLASGRIDEVRSVVADRVAAGTVGRRASYLESDAEAEECIAGYVTVNDVSERAFQIERGGQWSKGKSCPTFNPAGPYLVTPDEVGDVLDLRLWLEVDGVRKQDSSTAQMIFSPAFIVRYLSQFLTLEPGDLINTGTPPGVGMGFTPPQFLRGGEEIPLGIAGLGEQRQRVLV